MAGWGGGVGYRSLSPVEGRNGMNEAFLQKKTHNAVTSALPRPSNGPPQESCVLLMCGSEVLDASHTWGRTAEVKERMKQVHPAALFVFAAGQEARTTW